MSAFVDVDEMCCIVPEEERGSRPCRCGCSAPDDETEVVLMTAVLGRVTAGGMTGLEGRRTTLQHECTNDATIMG